MRVLVSAYACRPKRGSEPGVGWNLVREVAKYHEVWAITQDDDRRETIEAELSENPSLKLRFVYYDVPHWIRRYKRFEGLGALMHYYLWQLGAYYFIARDLHRRLDFDLVHHVTYVKYSMPSFLALLPTKFLWGPVGGGESAPKKFWRNFGSRGVLYESLRSLARWLGEHDPFVHLTARRSALVLELPRKRPSECAS